MGELDGKVALVTGAARRLGREMSLALAEAGARVVLHHRRSGAEAAALAAEIAAAGGQARCLCADLADPREARRLAHDAAAAFGALDIVVNNASLFFATPLATATDAQWDELMAVNLRAPWALSHEAAPLLGDGGAIVNVADASVETPWPDHVAYQVSKAGLIALTLGLARALAPRLRVNAVAPGPILLPEGATPEVERRALARVPLGRLGDPADIARAVVFLARPSFLTGAVIHVDGGRRLG